MNRNFLLVVVALLAGCASDDPVGASPDRGAAHDAGLDASGRSVAPPWRDDFPADEYTEYLVDRTEPYECGTVTCEPVDDGTTIDSGAVDAFVANLEMDPCCTDTGACGITSTTFFPGYCFLRHDPGVPDSSCPSANLVLAQFDGCCRPDGRCGIDASSFTAGCVERTAFSQALNSGQGASLMLSFEEVACTYTPDSGAPR